MKRSVPRTRGRPRVRAGRAIRQARLDYDVSASELAAALGVSTEAVLAWERGSTGLRLGRLRQIAVALGVPLEHLLG